MAYRLRRKESASQGLSRIAREQLDKATDELADESLDRHHVVHQVRKRFKKIRGLIRLVRPTLGDTYGRENRWYRDEGRRLSRVRDAESLLEALQRLCKRFPQQFDNDTFQTVHERLRQRRKRIADDWLDLDATLDDLRSRLRCARRRVDEWSLDTKGFDAVAGGLKKTYRRGRRALDQSRDDPTDGRLHEWRKRTKYHWYQMRLLRGLWKPVIGARVDESDRLSDLLGDDHDLAVFRRIVEKSPEEFGDPDTVDMLKDLINLRRRELQCQANRLGQRVFAERPKCFINRFQAYWQARHRK